MKNDSEQRMSDSLYYNLLNVFYDIFILLLK